MTSHSSSPLQKEIIYTHVDHPLLVVCLKPLGLTTREGKSDKEGVIVVNSLSSLLVPLESLYNIHEYLFLSQWGLHYSVLFIQTSYRVLLLSSCLQGPK